MLALLKTETKKKKDTNVYTEVEGDKDREKPRDIRKGCRERGAWDTKRTDRSQVLDLTLSPHSPTFLNTVPLYSH